MGTARFRRFVLYTLALAPLILSSIAVTLSIDPFTSVSGPVALVFTVLSLTYRFVPLGTGLDGSLLPLLALQLLIPTLPFSLLHMFVGVAIAKGLLTRIGLEK